MNSEKNVTGLDGLSPGERQTLAELNAMTTGEPMPQPQVAASSQIEQVIAQPQALPQVAQPQPAPQALPQVAQPQPAPQALPQVAQPQPAPQALPQVAQPQPAPQAQPLPQTPAFVAPMPEDPARVTAIDTELKTLSTEKAAMAKKLDDGEMDLAEFLPKQDEINNKVNRLTVEQARLEDYGKMNAKAKDNHWVTTQQQFFAAPQNKPFLETASLRNKMDEHVTRMGKDPQYAHISDAQALQMARDLVAADPQAKADFVAVFGEPAWSNITGQPAPQPLPPQAQPQPLPQPQPAPQAQPQTGPVTLGDVPAAMQHTDQPGGPANAILNSIETLPTADSINSWHNEAAVDQLTPVQQDALALEAARRDVEAGY